MLTPLFIDTEFNSFKGELISIALVSEGGQEFYASLGCADPHPWVAEHVMPVIGIEPESMESLQQRLASFLALFPLGVNIIADWPEDLAHFCDLLITGPGARIAVPAIVMTFDSSLDADSEVPHNALHDARANRAQWLQKTFRPCQDGIR